MPKDKGHEWDYVTVIDDGGDKGVAYRAYINEMLVLR